MSSSRHPHLPQPPQTSVSRSVDVAPLILGHPAIRLLKALIGNPPRTANLDPLTFPAGTVGNIRKSQEIQMQTNLMASTQRSNSGDARNDLVTAYMYSLAFKVPRTVSNVETFRDPLDLVNHDNLRGADEYFSRPLPPPSKKAFHVGEEEFYVVKDFFVHKKTVTIKAGTKVKIITKGKSRNGLSLSHLYYGFSRIVLTKEEVDYTTDYVGTDNFSLLVTAT